MPRRQPERTRLRRAPVALALAAGPDPKNGRAETAIAGRDQAPRSYPSRRSGPRVRVWAVKSASGRTYYGRKVDALEHLVRDVDQLGRATMWTRLMSRRDLRLLARRGQLELGR